MFLFVACGSKPVEPTNPVRVATNRIVLRKCNDNTTHCVGGFVKSMADNQIWRIVTGEPSKPSDIEVSMLLFLFAFRGDEELDRYEFVLSDSPEWTKTVIAYAEQSAGFR